jgi:hypothetical protein
MLSFRSILMPLIFVRRGGGVYSHKEFAAILASLMTMDSAYGRGMAHPLPKSNL